MLPCAWAAPGGALTCSGTLVLSQIVSFLEQLVFSQGVLCASSCQGNTPQAWALSMLETRCCD